MSVYSDTIRQWATDTRRAGLLDDADGTGEVGLESSLAGQRLAVRFTQKVERDRVVDARYQVFGCGFSMAACAVAADLAVGDSLDEVRRIDAQRLGTVLEGLPEERSYCADLAVEALQAAVRSARDDHRPVPASLQGKEEHGARITVDDPVYRLLMATSSQPAVAVEDRHLFACLLAVAAREGTEPGATLGLKPQDLDAILARFFPGIHRMAIRQQAQDKPTSPPQASPDVLAVLASYRSHGETDAVPAWLCRILATRAALPGHLWVAMGLTERPQLTAAIRRHLPSLAAANDRNMRWKRFLYKQVCDRNGGTLCKAPNCGVCSDYSLCFAEDGVDRGDSPLPPPETEG